MACLVSMVTVLLFISQASAAPFPAKTTQPQGCYYSGHTYVSGEQVPTDQPCLNCSCLSSSLVCFLRVCPKFPHPPPRGCFISSKSDQCCPNLKCDGIEKEAEHQEHREETHDSSSGHYEGTQKEKKTHVMSSSGCIFNGSLYAEGSAMVSSNHCEYCFCVKSKSRCIKPRCTLPLEGCTPMYTSFSCCPSHYDCDAAKNGTQPSDHYGLRAHSMLGIQALSKLSVAGSSAGGLGSEGSVKAVSNDLLAEESRARLFSVIPPDGFSFKEKEENERNTSSDRAEKGSVGILDENSANIPVHGSMATESVSDKPSAIESLVAEASVQGSILSNELPSPPSNSTIFLNGGLKLVSGQGGNEGDSNSEALDGEELKMHIKAANQETKDDMENMETDGMKEKDEMKDMDKDEMKDMEKDGMMDMEKDEMKDMEKDGMKDMEKDEIKEMEKDGMKEMEKDEMKDMEKYKMKEMEKDGMKDMEKDGMKEMDGMKDMEKDEMKDMEKDGMKDMEKDGMMDMEKDEMKEMEKDKMKEMEKDGMKELEKDKMKDMEKTMRETVNVVDSDSIQKMESNSGMSMTNFGVNLTSTPDEASNEIGGGSQSKGAPDGTQPQLEIVTGQAVPGQAVSGPTRGSVGDILKPLLIGGLDSVETEGGQDDNNLVLFTNHVIGVHDDGLALGQPGVLSRNPVIEFADLFKNPAVQPLPNLQIIPFVAADAVTDDSKLIDEVKLKIDLPLKPGLASLGIGSVSPVASPAVEVGLDLAEEAPLTTTHKPILFNIPEDIGGHSARPEAPLESIEPISSDPEVKDKCFFDNRLYNNGELITKKDPCVLCRCYFGDILCQKTECPPIPPGCKPWGQLDFCCPQLVCENGTVHQQDSFPDLKPIGTTSLRPPPRITTSPNPFQDVIKPQPAPQFSQTPPSLGSPLLNQLPPFVVPIGQPSTSPTPEPITTPPVTVTSRPENSFNLPVSSDNQKSDFFLNSLNLSGCNIYGRMYRVGRVIDELSGPCIECKCTPIGVECENLKC